MGQVIPLSLTVGLEHQLQSNQCQIQLAIRRVQQVQLLQEIQELLDREKLRVLTPEISMVNQLDMVNKRELLINVNQRDFWPSKNIIPAKRISHNRFNQRMDAQAPTFHPALASLNLAIS